MNRNTIQNTPSLGRAGIGLTIIAIIGPSGSGKDTFARMLADRTPYELLISYTTRPIREGEVNGREHHFVSECNEPREKMLAYTNYGGYEYWVPLPEDYACAPSCSESAPSIQGRAGGGSPFIYVIDEDGIRSIIDRFPDINIVKILVTANRDIRRTRGVTEERMKRDAERNQFPLEAFDVIIRNNKSLSALKHYADDLAQQFRNRKHL